jgi:hypothetical protein
MQTARNRRRDTITRRINEQIQVALRDMGASEKVVCKIPEMSAGELYVAAQSLNADPYLLAYIGSWGDTLVDPDIFKLLQQWNARTRVANN